MPGRVARWPIALLWFAVALGFWFVVLHPVDFDPLSWWRTQVQPSAVQATPLRAVPIGSVSVAQPIRIATDSSVSAVPLALHLTATRLGRNSLDGYADIGVDVYSPQTFKAGAILANGARLAEIYADSVMLERSGQRFRLYLEGKGPPAVDAVVPSSAEHSSLATVGGAAPVPPASADSHEALTDVVRIAPVFDGDRVRALELYPSAHPEVFARLGFEPGDQIVAIDGVAIKDARESLAALRQLTAGAALVLTIERGGKRQSLSVDGSILRSGERG